MARRVATDDNRQWQRGHSEIEISDYLDIKERMFIQADLSGFWSNWSGQGYQLPEIRLLQSVLKDAIETYDRLRSKSLLGRSDQRIFDELKSWFESDEDDYVFSFAFIVDAIFPQVGVRRLRRTILSGKGVRPNEKSKEEEESLKPRSEIG